MMKRLWPLLLLLAACARYPIQHELTIEPERDADTVIVTASTSFALDDVPEDIREAVEHARASAQAGTDPWSIRFGRLSNADEDRVTYQRKRGTLERVTRSARIPSDDLQQLLSDTNITVHVLRGDGWRELSFYPGTGGRASREQQRDFDAALSNWSEALADYYRAIDHLYAYLRVNPHRDDEVFAALFGDKEILLPEEEQAFVDGVLIAMENIGDRMDRFEVSAPAFFEAADLIFNPFPARTVIRLPGDVFASEGFTSKDGALIVERIDLLAAISELEGRWISPDPLVTLMRDEKADPKEFAARRRKSEAVVNSAEIARAIREKLQRPRMYSVRWRD